MSEVGIAATIRADQKAESTPSTQKQGTLKAGGEEHTVYPIPDSEAISQGVDQFLQQANQQQELPESLLNHQFTHFTQETIENELEMMELSQELMKLETDEKSELPKETRTSNPSHASQQTGKNLQTPDPKVYSSLFSLASSFNKKMSEAKNAPKGEVRQERTHSREEVQARLNLALPTQETQSQENIQSETRYDQEGKERDQDGEEKEGFGGQQEQKQEQKKKQALLNPKVGASRSVSSRKTNQPSTNTSRISKNERRRSSSTSRSSQGRVRGVENIFIRFMALMARILGQAEAEAHDLYQRIKARTDDVDTLTLFISKINSSNGNIDWSKDEQMKQLVDKVRALGVDIPEGKYAWKEDEKKLLKENIQMRKDSMEKVTQLERTDMQRYLQEASQCHQARSNVLKLLKEVMDTIIHNMRP